MAISSGITTRIAQWVATVPLSAVPERVREKARYQIASVTAAVLAGSTTVGARAVASLSTPGPAPLLPTRQTVRVEDAVAAAAAASMAHDYDDYLLFGHTGHSAVLVPLLLAAETGATSQEVLAAQIVANEVGGRVGAAMVLGPHNGQMWAAIHAVGAACAASRLFGLDPAQTRDAIGIALFLPPFPVTSGFMGPSSKLLTAALPAVNGLIAARLARSGMTGAPDILGSPQGFLAEFCTAALPQFLTGLGRAWVTDTLAYKIYPGCAYVDAAVDATLAILERLGEPGGIDPVRVDRIDVRATALTIGMEHLSGEGPPTAIRANFSAALSVGLALLHGRLTPLELEPGRIAADGDRLRALSSRTRIVHDWDATVRLLRALDSSLHLRRLLRGVDPAALRRAGREALRRTGVRLGASPREIGALFLAAGLAGGRFAWDAARNAWGRESARSDPYDLGLARLDEFEFPIGAEVTLRVDGIDHRERVVRPKGTPGDWPATFGLVSDKLVAEAARRGRGPEGRRLMDKIVRFEAHSPADILESLSILGGDS